MGLDITAYSNLKKIDCAIMNVEHLEEARQRIYSAYVAMEDALESPLRSLETEYPNLDSFTNGKFDEA